MAQTSIMLDCDNCGGTGYENLHSQLTVPASIRPGPIARWNYVQGAQDFLGEFGIKLDYRYKDLLDRAAYIRVDGIDWKFSLLREPGEAMGQKRIVLALTRK